MNQAIQKIAKSRVWDRLTEIDEVEKNGHDRCVGTSDYQIMTVSILINNEPRYFKYKLNNPVDTDLLNRCVEDKFYGDKERRNEQRS